MKALIHEERLGELIKSSLSLMCKTSLRYTTEVEIKGLLGITLDKTSVFLVDVKELIRSEEYSDGDYDNEEDDNDDDYIPGYENTTQSPKLWSQKRSKQLKPKESKRRKRTPEKITKQEQNDQSLNSEHDNFNQDILDENGDGAAGGADMLQDMADNTVEQPRFGDSDAEREMTGYSAVKVEKPDTGVFDDDNADFCDDADDNYDEDNESGSKLGDDIVQDPTKSSASEINTSGTTESMEDIKTMAATGYNKATQDIEDSLKFQCDLCNFTGSTISVMYEHRKKCPSTATATGCSFEKGDDSSQQLQEKGDNLKFQCDLCKFTGSTIAVIYEHRKTCLKTQKTFPCDYPGCKRYFRIPSQLKGHQKLVHGPPLHCNICQKPLKTKSGLLDHMIAMHGKEGTYKCTFAGCNKSFQSNNHLQRHIDTHNKTKTYPCKNCNKKFHSLGSQVAHQKRCCSGEVFWCHICRKEFKTAADLSQHEIGMHRDTVHSCENCGKVFKWKNRMYTHKKVCPKK